jgi:hypothetical protein
MEKNEQTHGLQLYKLHQNAELYNLFRDYPNHMLLTSLEKLRCIDRNIFLKPKKPLLISNLSIHNPSILLKYKIKIDDLSVPAVA